MGADDRDDSFSYYSPPSEYKASTYLNRTSSDRDDSFSYYSPPSEYKADIYLNKPSSTSGSSSSGSLGVSRGASSGGAMLMTTAAVQTAQAEQKAESEKIDVNKALYGGQEPQASPFAEAIAGKKSGTYTPVQTAQIPQETKLRGEEVAYATGKPIPETFQPLVAPKQLTVEEMRKAEEMKAYEEKLKEIPAYNIGSQLSDWAREQFEKMWSSPMDFFIGLGAWFPYVIGEGLKGVAAAEALKASVGYSAAEKLGIKNENVPEFAKDTEKAAFLTQYYSINVATELGLGYATGKAVGFAAKGVAKIIPQTVKENVAKGISAVRESVEGRTQEFVYREVYSPSAEIPEHFTIATVEGKGIKQIAAEAGPFKLETVAEPLRTPFGEIQPKIEFQQTKGMVTSGLAKPSEEIAYSARVQTSFVVGKAKPGEELKSIVEQVYPTERGFVGFSKAVGKFGDIRIEWTTYEAGARPSLTTGFIGRTVSGKEVSAFMKEYPIGESVVYWARLHGRRFFTKFDIYAAPIKEGERESLVIFEKSRLIFPWAKEKYTFVKIQSETARYVPIEKGVYRTAFEPENLKKMLLSVYPRQMLPETEKRVPSSIRLAVFGRLQTELVEKPKFRGVPAKALEEALVIAKSEQLQKAFGIRTTQQTLIEQATRIKPKIALIPVPKIASAKMTGERRAKMMLSFGMTPAIKNIEKEAVKIKAPEMLKVGPKQTTFMSTTQSTKPKMRMSEMLSLQPPTPKITVPPAPMPMAGAVMPRFKIPTFIPFGSNKGLKGMWLREFMIDERKLAKKLMKGML